jgi:hypothetical protein
MSGLGWFGILLGFWWWQMAFSLFIGDYANELADDAVPHKAVILLGQNILYTTILCIAVNEMAKKMEGPKQLPTASTHKEDECSV